MKKRIDILFGVLTLIVLATLFSNANNEPRLSPGFQEGAPKLNSNIGLLHAPCSDACWNGDGCKQAESIKKESGNYLCMCSSCDNMDRCKLESETPSEFIWNCY